MEKNSKELIPTAEQIQLVLDSLERQLSQSRRSAQWAYLFCALACMIAFWAIMGPLRMVEITASVFAVSILIAAFRNRS